MTPGTVTLEDLLTGEYYRKKQLKEERKQLQRLMREKVKLLEQEGKPSIRNE